MSNGFTPVPGVDDDPAFVEEEAGQSIDPALVAADDLTGFTADPALADDPAATGADVADDQTARLLAEMLDDPIPLLVAQIKEEIEQLLRMHRDLYDGIELATDQVQDKRIEFLEQGPEVSVADIFIQLAFVFFIQSPLLKIVLGRAFRFAGDAGRVALLVSRRIKLGRLGSRLDKFRALKQQLRRIDGRIADARFQQAAPDATPALIGFLERSARRQTRLRGGVERQLAALQPRLASPSQFARQTEVQAESLKTFFDQYNQVAVEYGVAAVKAAATQTTPSGRQAVPPPDTSSGQDSVGVQIKALGQDHLRNMELYLGLVAADADLLDRVAAREPALRPDCFNLLLEMHAALVRTQSERGTVLDVKTAASREFELLIWALLVADQFRFDPSPAERPGPILVPPPGLGVLGGLGPQLGETFARQQAKPPARLMAYFRARFFPDEQNLGDRELFERIKKVKADFLTSSEGASGLTLVQDLVFKGETAAPAPTTPAPAPSSP